MHKSFVLRFVEIRAQSLEDLFLMESGYLENGFQLREPPLQSFGLAAVID